MSKNGKRRWKGAAVGAACVALGALAGDARAGLVVSEIMYDPTGSNEFEYVELYNNGPAPIDLAGYVITRNLTLNPSAGANVPGGTLPAGGTAVLARTDGSGGRTLEGFQAAWGAGVNFVPVAAWPGLTNTGSGIGIGVWASVTDYQSDLAASDAGGNVFKYDHAAASVAYANGANGWPAGNDSASVYLTDVSADPSVGANWARSVAGVDGARNGASGTIAVAGSNVNVNRTADVGSPGTVVAAAPVPEPAGLGVIATGVAWAGARRRRRRHRGGGGLPEARPVGFTRR